MNGFGHSLETMRTAKQPPHHDALKILAPVLAGKKGALRRDFARTRLFSGKVSGHDRQGFEWRIHATLLRQEKPVTAADVMKLKFLALVAAAAEHDHGGHRMSRWFLVHRTETDKLGFPIRPRQRLHRTVTPR